MDEWLKDACESIDAGIFSGDSFDSEKAKVELKEYIDRWNRELYGES